MTACLSCGVALGRASSAAVSSLTLSSVPLVKLLVDAPTLLYLQLYAVR
jgi:hypothetical protein